MALLENREACEIPGRRISVLLLGEPKSGKSFLCKSYFESDEFNIDYPYEPTSIEEYSARMICGTKGFVDLRVLDCGSLKADKIPSNWLDFQVVMICIDLSKPWTCIFESLVKKFIPIAEYLKRKKSAHIMMIGCKEDLADSDDTAQEASEYCRTRGISMFLASSARDYKTVKKVFDCAVGFANRDYLKDLLHSKNQWAACENEGSSEGSFDSVDEEDSSAEAGGMEHSDDNLMSYRPQLVELLDGLEGSTANLVQNLIDYVDNRSLS